MAVADLVAATVHPGGRLPPGTISYPGLGRLDAGESHDDPCLVIDLDLDTFRRIAPSLQDIAWLAHGRTSTTNRKATRASVADLTTVQDYAVVVANRLPRMGGRSVACLVSLEGLGAWLPGGAPPPAASAGRIRLACLATWNFHTLEEPLSFGECLSALDRRPLRPSGDVPAWSPGEDYVAAAFEMGYAPMPHRERDGGLAVSWYRGPFTPLAVPRTVTLPLDGSDAALIEDLRTQLLDVSYAAAWQIGQLLALQDRAFSTALYRWKIATRRDAVASVERDLLSQRLGQPEARGGAAGWLANRPPPSVAPAAIVEWLARLRLLKGVPFSYLVPDEAMLPPESIRFFHVDPNWLDCLVDGAYSLGRFTAGDLVHDDRHAAGLHGAAEKAVRWSLRPDSGGAGGTVVSATGFLLRSKAVSFWPGMEIEGKNKAGDLLPLLRFETLSPSLMLAVFDGVAEEFILHEPAEAIHFGVDLHLKSGIASKELRANSTPVAVAFRSGGHVLEIAALAASMRQAFSGGLFTQAEFAREMIEGVGCVIFKQSEARLERR